MSKLPKAPFEKILKEADKKMRVSDAAAAFLTEIMHKEARSLAEEAAELAKHAGRKTIVADDVRFACKRRQ